ncbi:MAG TPA: formylglycine-generating enzyme family protein [Verrucomicrobiota bacterium]|nr:formylglycine-generating enzyme family protein [Verrucomicrobiota bacterium]HNU52306.1 formylglycine-generating enzyme family protein [Verrucomicrobiota bacterium]
MSALIHRCPAAHRGRRRHTPAWDWIRFSVLTWVALARAWGQAPAVPPADPPSAAPLATVLEIERPADTDLFLMADGERRRGRLMLETLLLHTPHGPLRLPARKLAGIALADRRGGLDTLVTVNANCFRGLLDAPVFVLADPESAAPATLRRESLLKIVLQRRPGELDTFRRGWQVQLRDGTWFTGRLPQACFQVEAGPGQTNLLGTALPVLAAVADPDDHRSWRLDVETGETVRAVMVGEDLTFDLDLGLEWSVNVRSLESLRRPGVLPLALSRRLGLDRVLPEVARPRAAAAIPDPAVVPVPGMVWIEPGEFSLGSLPEEKDRDPDEGPPTRCVIPGGFWMGDHEVTQAEYESVTGTNPSLYLGEARRPVERVSWLDAEAFCRKLTEKEQAAGHLPATHVYRLPTEAEWEYACRANTSSRFSFGDDPAYARLQDHGWYNRNSDSAPSIVRQKIPNPWRLHDVHGNVWEWCLDEWRSAHPGGVVTNRVVPPQGNLRVARGGSWLYDARFCRSANRDSYGVRNRCSDVGFRIVLALQESSPQPRMPQPGESPPLETDAAAFGKP